MEEPMISLDALDGAPIYQLDYLIFVYLDEKLSGHFLLNHYDIIKKLFYLEHANNLLLQRRSHLQER